MQKKTFSDFVPWMMAQRRSRSIREIGYLKSSWTVTGLSTVFDAAGKPHLWRCSQARWASTIIGTKSRARDYVPNVEFIVMPTKVVSLVIRLGQIEIVGLMYSALS